MTLNDLLGLPLEQLQAMTNEDLQREFGHLLPAIRTPIQGMAGATDTTAKRKADKNLPSAKQEQYKTMLSSLSAIKSSLLAE